MGLFDIFLGNNKSSKDNNQLSLMDLVLMNEMDSKDKNKDNNFDYEDYQLEEEELEEDDYFFEDDVDN